MQSSYVSLKEWTKQHNWNECNWTKSQSATQNIFSLKSFAGLFPGLDSIQMFLMDLAAVFLLQYLSKLSHCKKFMIDWMTDR